MAHRFFFLHRFPHPYNNYIPIVSRTKIESYKLRSPKNPILSLGGCRTPHVTEGQKISHCGLLHFQQLSSFCLSNKSLPGSKVLAAGADGAVLANNAVRMMAERPKRPKMQRRDGPIPSTRRIPQSTAFAHDRLH
jgi:hypothetical protein